VPESDQKPNPEAIAWYVKRAEDLLDDLRERVQSLRSRGGQLAGFSGAVLALVGANAESMLEAVHCAARAATGVALLIGAVCLIAAFVTALRGTLLPNLVSDISAEEVANYTTERFTHEPDLWRVHVRTIRGLLISIDSTTRQGDKAAQAVRLAGRFFLVGLVTVGVALAILVAVVTF
jgi:cytochrome c biogenesis factor